MMLPVDHGREFRARLIAHHVSVPAQEGYYENHTRNVSSLRSLQHLFFYFQLCQFSIAVEDIYVIARERQGVGNRSRGF